MRTFQPDGLEGTTQHHEWGYTNDNVFGSPVLDDEALKARITDTTTTVSEKMWKNTRQRNGVLLATNGHILNLTKK